MKTSSVILISILAAAVCMPLNGRATTEVEPAASAPESAGSEAAADSVMDIPMHGENIEAFNASLERVKAGATEGQYKMLEMALDWLLLYDIGARGNREALYQRLDGKTPNEIIERTRR
jgi:hypothetical protein